MTTKDLRIPRELGEVVIDALGRPIRAMILTENERAARDRFDDLVSEVPEVLIARTTRRAGLLRIDLKTGSSIKVRSAQAHEAIRGESLDYVVTETPVPERTERDIHYATMARDGRRIHIAALDRQKIQPRP